MEKNRQSSQKQPNLFAYFKENTANSSNAKKSQNDIKTPQTSQRKMEQEDDLPKKLNSKLKIQEDSDQQEIQIDEKERRITEGRKTTKSERQPSTVTKSIAQTSEPIEWTDKTPEWALPPYCRDKNGRGVDDPNYDQTTLMIPQKQYSKLTNSMKQYWTFKAQHFDKVLFFKVGKFYQLFYEDAYISNKYLNLKWMGTKMHTGFPEKSLQYYLRTLIELGFKVVVIDQTQTPKEMQQRLRREKQQKGKKGDRVVIRQITAIHTKGTSTLGVSEQNYLPNYLISFFVRDNIHAFTLFDHMTNSIYVGISKSLDEFKSVIYNTRPSQLLFDPSNLPYSYKKMMTESFLGMSQSPLSNKNNQWHHMGCLKYFEGNIKAQDFLDSFQKQFGQQKQYAQRTLSGILSYLQSLYLLDSTLQVCRLKIYTNQSFISNSLVLDSQAVQHLELFQTANHQNPEQGSLFQTINRCSTNFGKRMLRQWLLQPLRNQRKINDRLDAVEDLHSMFIERKKLVDGFKTLGDLQRLVHRTYHFSVNSQSNKAILYEDLNVKKLKEIRDLIDKFKKAYALVMILKDKSSQISSSRLKYILAQSKKYNDIVDDQKIYFQDDQEPKSQGGLLPDVLSHLNQFDSYLKWDGDVPIPQKGLVQEYDQLQDILQMKKEELEKYLENIELKLKLKNIKFAHVKQRYQIEIPEEYQKPNNFIFSSRRNGFTRYVTKQSRNLVSQLEELEQNKKSQLKIFVNFFCQQFSKKKNIWQRFVRILAEIDCMISLSLVSYQWQGCRPVFNNSNGMRIEEGVHPCLKSSTFIPNSIILTSENNIMMLTGPNMGGKSTLLRMACLNIILAQIGVRVPCKSYDCHLFDRIFTRIGASDRLQQGKSTFYIEMQEALSILKSATQRSFVIMDELGRGTSTFDGMSIAYGVIKELAENTKCLGIISTHYHILIQQFMKHQSVELQTMSYEVDNRSKSIIFLYKAVKGYCTQSFAFNVLKAVGLESIIRDRAEEKASKIYCQIKEKRNQQLDVRLQRYMDV